MKSKNRKLNKIAFAGVLAVFFAISFITAYLTDDKNLLNLFTVGKADVEIDEGSFEQRQTIYPNIAVDKKPVLKNTGTIDEYVFAEISVPKKEICILTDVTENSGVKTNTNAFVVTAEKGAGETDDNIGAAGSDSDFTYHKKNDTAAGWVFLEKTTSETEAKYVFGYSTKVAPGASTAAVFDKVTLKNMIEEEIEGGSELSIGINAMCIQANNVEGLTIGDELTEANLRDIYKICVNKGLNAA